MVKRDNFSYRCKFEIEILVNREQEYIRNKKRSDLDFDDYASDFEDTDFENAKRWIKGSTISFYAKSVEEIKEKIQFEFHNGRIDTTPLVEEGYFYWFDNNCLVDQQRMLHRANLSIDYACDVDITDADLTEVSIKEKIEEDLK